jgi:hypothetical protein
MRAGPRLFLIAEPYTGERLCFGADSRRSSAATHATEAADNRGDEGGVDSVVATEVAATAAIAQ